MRNVMTVHSLHLSMPAFQGLRLATFAIVDEAHQRTKDKASKAFKSNRARFIEVEEFSDSIKKGSNANIPLWLSPNMDHSSCASVLALRRSALSFRPHASSTQDEKLASGLSVLSRSMLASISSITSWGKRIPLVSDLLFLYPVAILKSPIKCICTIRENINIKRIDVFMHQRLRCLCTLSTGKAQVIPKIAKPRSARTLAGPLTKPLYEVTIMADSQHTQTRRKFQYRFLALDRANRRATPCRLTVEASTEHEARLILCAHFILSLAARLPVSGSAHE
ncbi:host cell division inhibitor Icd-like protein [Rouxiella badensis]|uniref:host cell division inhibitor Icd-like protein n=1 Tax=Rouxiella badensis TaxID=1646377 RepID=UPI003C6E62AD